MKKVITTLVLSVFLLISLIPMSTAFAAESTNIVLSADKTTAYPDDVINFTVSIGAVEHLMGAEFMVTIPAGMTYVAGSAAVADGLKTTLGCASADWTESTMKFSAYGDGDYSSQSNTKILTFSCKIDANAVGMIVPQLTDIVLSNTDYEEIETSVNDNAGIVTVEQREEECNHVFTNYVSDNNATCTADGTKTAYCDNGCGEKKTIADEGSKLAHTFNKEVKNANTIKSAATCTEDAVYFLSCDCGTVSTSAVFADADTALGHDMTVEKADAESHWTQCSRCEEITGKAAHTDADGIIEADASAHWYTCSCGTVFGKAAHSGGTATETEKAICETCGTAYGTIDSCTHDGAKEVRNAVAATCSKDGYSGDTYCKECGILLSEGKVIKSTGKHSYKLVKYEEATPDKNGYKLYECADCGATKEETIFYSINTGVEDLLTPAAAVILLSGAVFFCSNKLRKKEENI
ncbi:MAG: hypothetical protein IJO14_00485 [Clostridia bacterium]|nr:hypothetical protein [Clostridia bacterium]